MWEEGMGEEEGGETVMGIYNKRGNLIKKRKIWSSKQDLHNDTSWHTTGEKGNLTVSPP